MAKTKKKTSQLLALFMAAILVFSNFGSVAVAATTAEKGTDCDIVSYTETDELKESDKTDSTQANTQTSTLTTSDGTGATYSTSLLQSAEWISKTTGTAELNIHYEADFDDITATRSVYVFTTCIAHSFNEKVAIENIIDLLEYNDYVDIIMIGTVNSTDTTNDAKDITAASQFSLSASDFENLSDGLESTNFNSTYGNYQGDINANTKAAMIAKVLETYLNSTAECTEQSACDYGSNCTENNFANISYAYKIGSEGEGNGSVEVLYSDVTDFSGGVAYYDTIRHYRQTFYSATELALTFGGNRHAGMYLSLYYLTKYIETIENNYGDFSSTVSAIFNSFDGLDTAGINHDTNSWSTTTLYEKVEEYIGVKLGTGSSNLLSDMNVSCASALSVLQTYQSEGRYIALVSDNGNGGYNFGNIYYKSAAPLDSYKTVNELLYSLVLVDFQVEPNTKGFLLYLFAHVRIGIRVLS